MKFFNESEIKYLAGLMDADGHLSFSFTDQRVYLEMGLAASESIDKHGYLFSLGEKAGNVTIRQWEDKNWSPSRQWRVSSKSEINMLLPRIIKHMVIKGTHWNNLYNKWREFQTKILTEEEIVYLKTYSTESRKIAKPLKPKNHPTWAWVAGYLDGDGSYTFRKHSNPEAKNCMSLKIMVVCHKDDRVGIDLLFKAFGGSIREEKDWLRWNRNLGVADSSFAIEFLRKVHRHSNLKKWKIEQMLAFHNNRLQRLSVENPTG